jgi:uncharacterized coiled-coil DUF342 family protein
VLKSQISELDQKLVDIRDKNVDLANEINDLKLKGGELSVIYFDKVNSQLGISKSDIVQKDLKIKSLENDLLRTVAALKDFHQRMVKLDSFA